MPLLESVPYRYYAYQNSTHSDSRFPGQTFVDSQYNILTTLATNSRTGVQNPNWRQQVARKTDATTEYERIWTSGRSCRLYADNQTDNRSINMHTYGRSEVSFQMGQTLINSSDDTVIRELALSRLKRRLSDNIGNMDTIVPVAELRELRGLVRNTAALATDAVRTLIDIRRTRGRSAVQWAADAWLNFNFGVRPLISDTQAAAQSVASFLDRSDHSARLSGTASKTWFSSTSTSNNTGTYLLPHSRLADARHTLSYRYTCGLDLKLKSSNNYGYTDHFGIGFEQLPSVAWELVPFSWVADYFGTVGDYLSDTFVLPPGSTKYLVLTKRYIMEVRISGIHYAVQTAGTSNAVLANVCIPGFLKHVRLNRTKLSSLPRASLRFRSVDEIGIGAVNRLLNLSSVLVSGGRRPRA